jgi:hypothetical protein
MRWDDITLAILADFGCVTLLLAQLNDLLGKLPEIIRAWRRVRRELESGDGTSGGSPSGPDDAG